MTFMRFSKTVVVLLRILHSATAETTDHGDDSFLLGVFFFTRTLELWREALNHTV
jgi:hypothetical protein